jgi:hypothetical protein
MGKKDKQKAAARARAGRATIRTNGTPAEIQDIEPEIIFIDDTSDCDYTGGVNYISYSDEKDAWKSESSDSSHSNSDTESEEIGEMEGEELEKSLQALKVVIELHKAEDSILDALGKDMPGKAWAKAKSNRALGYSGNLGRSKRCRHKEAQDHAMA